MIRPSRGLLPAALACWLVLLPAVACAQLSPDDELKTLRPAEGLDVALFACEPLVTNPAAIDVDTHGRVWVAEIQFYRAGAKTPPADKIKVLEDTDGDGRADKVTVFADGVFAPMSICVAGDKIYVATSPDLWVYEDKDGDLKADGPPKKLLTGFGGQNHDHGAHSLVLGPDHKWWMSHGDAGFDVTGTDGSHVKFQWGAVLRGELDGSKLETVAVNFRNPYEVCVSSFGEPFLSDNDNDGNESVRICWIMEGGNYGWFGGPPFDKQELTSRLSADTPFRRHWHFRGYIPGFVPGTLVTGFGSPCGIAFYEGDAFGAKYKNAPLHVDPGPRECRVYRHEPAGFGMQATSETFLSNQGDNYFRPDDICAAPDGRLYISDWYDGGVGGHGYDNPEQGRIFVLTPKDKKLVRREKPGPYESVADAIEGLKSPNLATQFLAREKLLADAPSSVAALVALAADGEPNWRARALWLLDRIGGAARNSVVAALSNPDSSIRALAVRILRRHGDEHGDAILALARDPAAEVRREVLLAIRTLLGAKAEAALTEIAASYDVADRYQLEAINIAAGERKAELLARLEKKAPLSPAQFPLLQILNPARSAELTLERLAVAGLDEESGRALLQTAAAIPSLEAGLGLLRLAQNTDANVALRRAAFEKVVQNVNHRGAWSALAHGEQFPEAVKRLLGDRELRGDALRAVARLRMTALTLDVFAVASSPEVDSRTRVQAIEVATELHPKQFGLALGAWIADEDPAIRDATLRAAVDAQEVPLLRRVLSNDSFSPQARAAVVERLVDSVGGAVVALQLIDRDELPDELKKTAIAKAVSHADVNVRMLYDKFIPPGERPKKLGKAVTADQILALSGDPARGQGVFNKSSAAQCKKCHAVQGFGGSLGPELTNIGKKYERRALLETILEPSKAIAPEFIPYLLETKEGKIFAGFVVERSDAEIVLKDIGGKPIRVKTSEIESLVRQEKSLMPELILSEVTAQDAADLLAYLTTLQ